MRLIIVYQFRLIQYLEKNPYNLVALDNVLKIIASQAEEDGRLHNGQPTEQMPPDHPIKEYTLGKWMRMPISQRQFIHKSSTVIIRRSEALSYDNLEPDDVEVLLGNLDQSRVLHGKIAFHLHSGGSSYQSPSTDLSLEASGTLTDPEPAEESSGNDVHTSGTFRDVIKVCETQAKVVNVLSIPLPSSQVPAPTGLASQEEAEMVNRSRVDTSGRSWGLFATRHAMHPVHLDAMGMSTFLQPQTGLKYWVFGVPRKLEDLASIDAYGEEYAQDFRKSLGLKVYGVILHPGDQL